MEKVLVRSDSIQFEFNLLVTECGFAEKPFNSHKIGIWGLIESLNNIRIHVRPIRAQSRFENFDRERSNNESWQLVPWFNNPHGKSGIPSGSNCVIGGWDTVAEWGIHGYSSIHSQGHSIYQTIYVPAEHNFHDMITLTLSHKK